MKQERGTDKEWQRGPDSVCVLCIHVHAVTYKCTLLNLWVGASTHPLSALGEQYFNVTGLKGELLGILLLSTLDANCRLDVAHTTQSFTVSSGWALIATLYTWVSGGLITNRSILIHTEQVIGGGGGLELMGSLLALRGNRVDSRQCKKKWPVRTGPVGWTDWHQIACVLLHSLLHPRLDANVLGAVCAHDGK